MTTDDAPRPALGAADAGERAATLPERQALRDTARLVTLEMAYRRWARSVRWVGQEDGNGCGIACCAMLSGMTYRDVAADFDPAAMRSHVDYDQWLTEHGYALARRYRWWLGRERAVWPPKPWALVHLCEVLAPGASSGSHMVLLLADGWALDPLHGAPLSRLGDYTQVYHVAAVYPTAAIPMQGGSE